MTFQYVAWAAAVADFIPYVKCGPLLVAVEQLSGISTCVAGQSWREEGRKRTVNETVCHQVCVCHCFMQALTRAGNHLEPSAQHV